MLFGFTRFSIPQMAILAYESYAGMRSCRLYGDAGQRKRRSGNGCAHRIFLILDRGNAIRLQEFVVIDVPSIYSKLHRGDHACAHRPGWRHSDGYSCSASELQKPGIGRPMGKVSQLLAGGLIAFPKFISRGRRKCANEVGGVQVAQLCRQGR